MYIRDMSYIFGIAVIIIRTIIKVIVDLSCEKKKAFYKLQNSSNYGASKKLWYTVKILLYNKVSIR